MYTNKEKKQMFDFEKIVDELTRISKMTEEEFELWIAWEKFE